MFRPAQIPSRFAFPSVTVVRAFTLIELLLVMAIIGVVLGMAAPLLSGSNASRIRDAARLLAADLDVARTESIVHADSLRRVVLDEDGGGYQITTGDGSQPVTDPVSKNPYAVRFGSGRAQQLHGTTIVSHNLGVDRELEFGIYGETDRATDATMTLDCGGYRVTVTVDAGSGDVFLSDVSKP